MKKAIVIAGPTASGKSALSVALAKHIRSEVISADSMQIYRKLDIGTAKITESEKEGVVHHMIDIVEIGDSYTVQQYQKQAFEIIDDCNARGMIPVICGGTGLYLQALLYDLDFHQTPPDRAFRSDPVRVHTIETGALYDELMRLNERVAGSIHPNNRKRIIRALEVQKDGGTVRTGAENRFRAKRADLCALVLGISRPREALLNRIEARVDIMLDQGLIEECRDVLLPFGRDTQASAAIGYRETLDYLKGLLTRDELRQNIIVHTRQYAKRQMTWFRKFEDIHWIEPTATIEEIMRKYEDVFS